MAFPTTAKFIADAEAQLGVTLPPPLRRHLIAQNGGEVEAGNDTWQLFPVLDSTDRKRLARSANHIVRETAQAREWAGFPSAAVPIGSNGSGDYLVCMPMLGDETKLAEAVYVWDHETRQLSPVVVEWSEGGISLEPP